MYLLGDATPELNPELKAEAPPWVGVPAGEPPGLVEIRFPLLTLLKYKHKISITSKWTMPHNTYF